MTFLLVCCSLSAKPGGLQFGFTSGQNKGLQQVGLNVRFGSLADISAFNHHVCFVPQAEVGSADDKLLAGLGDPLDAWRC
jgi:hypothetical protein